MSSAEAKLPSHCNPDTKVAQCSGIPSLAGLHHVQSVTPWHWATTQPLSSFPHAGIFASCFQAKWSRSSPVPEHTTYRDPLSCLLCAGGIGNNVPACYDCLYPTPYLLVQVSQPLSPVAAHDTLCAGSSRQHRNQVWSVNPCVAQSRRTFVPGLPTPTGAAGGRRPGRPYTVVRV